MRTLARLREGKDLDTESFELVTNVMESFVMKLTTGERIRFQHVFGGYVIGTIAVSESVGLKYLYDLLQAGVVSCLHLLSGRITPAIHPSLSVSTYLREDLDAFLEQTDSDG